MDEYLFAGGAWLSQPGGKKMVSVIFASQEKTNFHTIHGYRVHGNRSDLEISPLFPRQNWVNKFGSMDSQFLFVSGLYAHKLHAPCSHAPCSRSHGGVVVLSSRVDFSQSFCPSPVQIANLT